MSNEHYVYVTINKEDFSVKYIGSGKGKRKDHVLSGRSSSVNANKTVLLGSGNFITAEIVNGLSQDTARQLESGLIYAIQPEWNNKGLNTQPNIAHTLLLDCLRTKAYLNYISFQEGYTSDSFQGAVSLLTYVLCRLELDDTPELIVKLYTVLDKTVDYFLEEGEWFDYTKV